LSLSGDLAGGAFRLINSNERMSGHLKRDEKLAHGLRRIARSHARVIRKCGLDQNPFARVHEARKGIKKLRALLRLVRRRLDDRQYKKQMTQLREMARTLAPVRDAGVQQQTLRKFHRSFRRRLAERALARWENFSAERNNEQFEVLTKYRKGWAARCASVLDGVEEWHLKGFASQHLRPGLKKSLKRFAKGYQKARRSPTVAALHEWRKRTKNLFFQLKFFNQRPKSVKRLASRLNELGETLGDDHDLALLERTARQLDPRLWQGIQQVTRKRRAKLQQSAFKLGRKLRGKKGMVF
jgi:hypothetical protein